MKKLLYSSLALGVLAVLSACTTVVQKTPTSRTTTTTEETRSVQPAPTGVTTTY
ncbi:hypothetical protein BH09VER1_BH09VER1_37520 [soil metagenome]